VDLGPSGSFVTQPCQDFHLGPLRNCGFGEQLDGIPDLASAASAAADETSTNSPFACAAGQQVQLTCDVAAAAAPQVIRICDYSEQLNSGVACTYSDALANVTVDETADLSFQCPLIRDENEPGGAFSVYTAPLFPEDADAPVSCAVASP